MHLIYIAKFVDMTSKESYLDHHNAQIEQHGHNVNALWGSEQSQQKRFMAFKNLFLSNQDFSVLDLGCGMAHFYDFLIKNGFKNIKYIGVDINEKLLNGCIQDYPEHIFIKGSVEDVIEQDIRFDYLVASGLYNLGNSEDEVRAFFLEQFSTLYENINIGFAVNFLSVNSPSPSEDSVYHHPETMMNACMEKFGNNICLMHNYLPHDFTIYQYKEMV